MIAILPFKGSITSQRISCIFLVDRIIELLTTRTGVNAANETFLHRTTNKLSLSARPQILG